MSDSEPEEPTGDRGSDDPPVDDLIEGLLGAVRMIDERLQAVESVVSTDEPDVNFAEWLQWLTETYGMADDLPSDWESIPGIRQELEALCAMWCTAYKRDGVPVRGAAAVRWHEALVSARDRIARYRTAASQRASMEHF